MCGCEPLHVPHKTYARDVGLPSPELDEANWNELDRWASELCNATSPLTWAIPTPYVDEYPRWPAVKGGVVTSVILTAVTAGSSDTTVDVMVNGVSQATATLASGSTSQTTDVSVSFDPGDLLSPKVTAVGTNMDRLAVQLRYR